MPFGKPQLYDRATTRATLALGIAARTNMIPKKLAIAKVVTFYRPMILQDR
jgi:hypothetical protein